MKDQNTAWESWKKEVESIMIRDGYASSGDPIGFDSLRKYFDDGISPEQTVDAEYYDPGYFPTC